MDKVSFCKYAELYKDTIFRVALNYFGNSYDADDAVQDVLTKLYTSTKRFDNDEHIKRWLIRVTLNVCHNIYRRRDRHEVSIEEVTAAVSFKEPEQLELFTAVMSLPEKYRTALYLFYYEDYFVKEIAKILRVTTSVVTTRLSRARALLKTQIMEGDADGR